MAGAGPMQPSSGGRRSLDAEINLVPFIDLLSVCICFLLMTAVWIQISTVQVKQSHGTEGGASGQYELDVRFQGPTTLQMELKKNGRSFKKTAIKNSDMNALMASMDTQLKGWLAGNLAVSSAMISPKTGVSYGTLVTAMDVLRKHQVVNLGVVPIAEGK